MHNRTIKMVTIAQSHNQHGNNSTIAQDILQALPKNEIKKFTIKHNHTINKKLNFSNEIPKKWSFFKHIHVPQFLRNLMLQNKQLFPHNHYEISRYGKILLISKFCHLRAPIIVIIHDLCISTLYGWALWIWLFQSKQLFLHNHHISSRYGKILL